MTNENNILGIKPIPELLVKFAVPSVISLLVNSIYNLVDQIFIGQWVGYLGNAATNVAFPFVTLSMAVSLMISVGTAANVGLNLGRKNQEEADKTLATGFTLAVIVGLLIFIVAEAFMPQLLRLFGATDTVYPYAIDYARIYMIGTIFITVGIMISDEVRADGNPKYAMMSMLIGAAFNIVFDPILIYVVGWGVKGAALATIMGQFATMIVLLLYLRRLKTMHLRKENLGLNPYIVKNILGLGVSSFLTQIAILFVQIIMNRQSVKYGAMSKYGSDIPLTVFGIVMKVNQLMMALILGVTSGSQPIFSFNYGAKKFQRVKQLVRTALIVCVGIGFCCMLIFQLFPQQIISLFGQENDLYNEFAVMSIKNITIFIFVMGVQMVASVYFQSIGKPIGAAILSLSRQIIFMIPAMYILPIFFGIKGVMWSFPLADISSVILGAIMLSFEMRRLNKNIKQQMA